MDHSVKKNIILYDYSENLDPSAHAHSLIVDRLYSLSSRVMRKHYIVIASIESAQSNPYVHA